MFPFFTQIRDGNKWIEFCTKIFSQPKHTNLVSLWYTIVTFKRIFVQNFFKSFPYGLSISLLKLKCFWWLRGFLQRVSVRTSRTCSTCHALIISPAFIVSNQIPLITCTNHSILSEPIRRLNYYTTVPWLFLNNS